MKKTIILSLQVILLLSGCHQTRNDSAGSVNDSEPESLIILDPEQDIDQSDKKDKIPEAESDPNKISDIPFFDFFYSFTWEGFAPENIPTPERFQANHVKYPIQINVNFIQNKEQWKVITFPRSWEAIPVVFYDTAYINFKLFEGDINVTVMDYMAKTGFDLTFSVIDRKWMLTKVMPADFDDIDKDDFFSFLEKFSNDTLFQLNHVRFPFENNELEWTNFDRVKNYLHLSGWDHWNFSQSLKELYVINLNQKELNYRYLNYRGVECGVWAIYTFSKSNNKWQFVKAENYST